MVIGSYSSVRAFGQKLLSYLFFRKNAIRCFSIRRFVLSFQVDIIILVCRFQSTIVLGHTSVVLDTKTNEVNEEVCNGNAPKLCCHFNIKLKHEETFSENKSVYTYQLAAFSGVRSFGGVRDGGIEACAVLACLNESVQSCGKRYISV